MSLQWVARWRDAGVQLELAVVLEAVDPLVAHGDDEHPTVGQPAETRRLPGHRADALALALGVDGEHRALEEVGVPEAVLVPARPFAEVEAVDECLECGHAAFSRPTAFAATEPASVRARSHFPFGHAATFRSGTEPPSVRARSRREMVIAMAVPVPVLISDPT